MNEIRCEINEDVRKIARSTIAHRCADKYNETQLWIKKFSPKYLLENTNILPTKWNRDAHKRTSSCIREHKKSHLYNELFDKDTKRHPLDVGDAVYAENANRLNRQKLDRLKSGPYRIIRKMTNWIYEIDTGHIKQIRISSTWPNLFLPLYNRATEPYYSDFGGGGEM